MNSFKNLLIPLGTLVLALAIVVGAAYAYEKQSVTSRQNDSLINSAQNQFRQQTTQEQREEALAQAQAALQSATVRLNELRSQLSPVSAIANAYDTINKDASTLAAAALPQNGAAASEINTASQNLADTLQAWKLLISNIPSSGPSPSQIAESEQYAKQAQTYMNQIQTSADNLTPSDSDLTQSQINSLQSTTAAASDSASNTSNDLAIALPVTNDNSNTDAGSSQTTDSNSSSETSSTDNSQTPSSNSNASTGSNTSSNQSSDVTASDVAAQQQTVDQLQNQVDQLQQQDTSSSTDQNTDNTSTAAPGTLDTTPYQPPQFDIYGRPLLIEGMNKQ